ncbi:DUF6541 family protein [Brachybacterium sp. AOP25-B2-12]|uniref:DUF6541 family protein n=1 Tax=Brachybacterium sp. AOP25-B2-12 TaxID=3457710 RepID=UPI0040332949
MLDVLGPTVLAWLLLCGPGALVLRAGGARLGWIWGAAPAVTVVLAVALGAVGRALGIPWTPLGAGVQLAVVVLVVAGGRWVRRRLRSRRGDDGSGRTDLTGDAAELGGSDGVAGSAGAAARSPRQRVLDGLPAVVGAGIGLAMAMSAARGMGGIDTLNGSYDAYFHIAAIEYIRADRDGFLPTALEGIYHAPTFYPAGWDIITALLPWDTVTSANAMVLAMIAALPGSLGAMIALVLGRRAPAAERRVLPALAAACAPLSLSVPVIALVLGLWPFVLGALCLPVALGAVWALVHDLRSGVRRPAALWPYPVILTGMVLAHPSTLFSLAVAVLAGMIAQGVLDVLRPATRRRGALLLAGILLALGAYAVGSRVLLASMDLTTAAPWPWVEFLASVVLERPRIASLGVEVWAVAALWALAVVGAVATVRTRGRLGASAIVLLGLALALTVLTNLTSPLARTWVNPWYGARERIAPLLVCALVVLAVLGVRALWRRGREGRARRVAAAALVLVLAGTSVTAILVPTRLPFVGSLAYTAYGVQLAPYVTPAEREFIQRSAARLPADAVVIGNPRDGTALYWSLGGVETVFPTLSEPQTLDSRRVARYAHKAGYDPRVCASLRAVAPTHLYVDRSARSGAAIAPEAAILYEGLALIPADRLVLVDEDGPYALYRIEPLC